jgi:hypothetical protein
VVTDFGLEVYTPVVFVEIPIEFLGASSLRSGLSIILKESWNKLDFRLVHIDDP